jgi:hypothetical protein
MEPKKKRPRSKRGKCINWSNPNWEPILHLARIYVDEFMWMCEIELRGGTRLQAYKHYWTRQYLHLDGEANAFAYRGDDLYRRVPEEELRELFDRVVRRPDPAEPIRERFLPADEWESSEESGDIGDLPTIPF